MLHSALDHGEEIKRHANLVGYISERYNSFLSDLLTGQMLFIQVEVSEIRSRMTKTLAEMEAVKADMEENVAELEAKTAELNSKPGLYQRNVGRECYQRYVGQVGSKQLGYERKLGRVGEKRGRDGSKR